MLTAYCAVFKWDFLHETRTTSPYSGCSLSAFEGKRVILNFSSVFMANSLLIMVFKWNSQYKRLNTFPFGGEVCLKAKG